MPSSIFFGMQHLNNNLMCSIGFDTTAADPDLGELIEFACVPLDARLNIHSELILFNMKMRPESPGTIDWSHCRATKPEVAAMCHSAFERDKVADFFHQWFLQMDLPRHKKIIPLGYKFYEARTWLVQWLGWDLYHEIFSTDYRDVLIAAHYLNDRADVKAQPLPFVSQTLRKIAKEMNVTMEETGGSPLDDARTIMETYKRLLQTL